MTCEWNTEALMEDLESRIDPEEEEQQKADWHALFFDRAKEDGFRPVRKEKKPSRCEWPDIHINDTQGPNDFDRMLVRQLAGVSGMLSGAGGGALSVRCNYGVAILASLFQGVEVVMMPRHMHNLPSCHSVHGDEKAIDRILETGVPDLNNGLGQSTFAMADYYTKAFAPYPKISKYVYIYHPDIQSPMDVTELVWGSEMYPVFYEDEDKMHRFLTLMTETYSAFMNKWLTIVPMPEDDVFPHWNLWTRGKLMLRDDTAMNLSGEMYRDFIFPYNQRLLEEFGGGAIHACGKVDHWFPEAVKLHKLYAFNLTQPHLNNCELILSLSVDKDIRLIGYNPEYTKDRPLHGRAHIG
jgi:hypothetical protein